MFRGKKITPLSYNNLMVGLSTYLSCSKRDSTIKCQKHPTISNTLSLCSFWLFSSFLVPLTNYTVFCLLACFSRVHRKYNVHIALILADVSAKVIVVWKSAHPPPSNQSCKYIKVKVHKWIRLLLLSFPALLQWTHLVPTIHGHSHSHTQSSCTTSLCRLNY